MGLLLKSVTEDNPYNGGDLLVEIETRITDSVHTLSSLMTCSSMVEHPAVNRKVVGSSPTGSVKLT